MCERDVSNYMNYNYYSICFQQASYQKTIFKIVTEKVYDYNISDEFCKLKS